MYEIFKGLSPVFTVSDYSESDYSHIYGRLPYGRPFPAPANGRSSGQQRQVYVSEWEWPIIMETPLTNHGTRKIEIEQRRAENPIKFWVKLSSDITVWLILNVQMVTSTIIVAKKN